MSAKDTVVAQATPPGHGGVAIVRISGPRVPEMMIQLLGRALPPRHAVYLPFQDNNEHMIDAGLALYFPAPNSFTGEDVLELHAHGGPVVVDLLVQRILTLGARVAQPGEFSERAFLNDKIDLTQAEAIADLINATSEQAARLAVRSMQGEFSKKIHTLVESVIHLRMYIEASIDFAEEEIDFLADEKIDQQLHRILQQLETIQEQAKQGSFLREGITAVIVGKPNVGKSSLLNALSGKELAIVTDIPGTTRDLLRDYILIDGMPMHIVDTAGLRESLDVVEQEGIRRAHQEMTQADLILYVVDTVGDIEKISSEKPTIIIRNKIDLTQEKPEIIERDDKTIVNLSVKNDAGLDLLKAAIKSTVGYQSAEEGQFLARRRHLDALIRATQHVQRGVAQLKSARAGELLAEDLRQAQQALSEITGEFSTDDLLGKIFSSFCVGK